MPRNLAPCLNPHPPHTQRTASPLHLYTCQKCIDREDVQRQTAIRARMKRLRANHCRKHSLRPPPLHGPFPARCICYEMVKAMAVGFTCRACYEIRAWPIVQRRARRWLRELYHTHRHMARMGRNATRCVDRTTGTYINAVSRVRPACPVKGCGRTAMTNEKDLKLIKTCLGCCGVYRAN